MFYNNVQYLCGYMPIFQTKVSYKLDKHTNALVFQVLDQSPDVTAFLANNTFLSPSTGFKVELSAKPEFKISKNTIFLRGSDKTNDFKPDVTRFVGKMQRDNAHELFIQTIQELVDTVKELSTATPVNVLGNAQVYGDTVNVRSYKRSYPTRNKNREIKIIIA